MKVIIEQVEDNSATGHHPQITIEGDTTHETAVQIAETYNEVVSQLKEKTNE